MVPVFSDTPSRCGALGQGGEDVNHGWFHSLDGAKDVLDEMCLRFHQTISKMFHTLYKKRFVVTRGISSRSLTHCRYSAASAAPWNLVISFLAEMKAPRWVDRVGETSAGPLGKDGE